MNKILGLDLGTNSIGWAIVEEEKIFQAPSNYTLLEKGVHIFSEGVKSENGKESSKAAERTKFRSARRIKFRRKLRKYETLKVLIKYGMCPLSIEELEKWRSFKEQETGKTKSFKNYPQSIEYLDWLRTDNQEERQDKLKGIKNPYYFRAKAVEEKLSPQQLGRALYHLTQRRGFLSNRFEVTDDAAFAEIKNEIGDELQNEHSIESLNNVVELIKTQSVDLEDEEQTDKRIIKLFKSIERNFPEPNRKKGKNNKAIVETLTIEEIKDNIGKALTRQENMGEVERGIKDLAKEIEEAGFKTLGQYFHKLYAQNQEKGTEKIKIRGRYTAREPQYLAEFEQICLTQELTGINKGEDLPSKRYSGIVLELFKAIFFQRPLKSQKGQVGKCSFEKSKPRCPVSHPAYEEFRALQFINNIRYRTKTGEWKQLDQTQLKSIWHLFVRKSSPNFEFKEIAKILSPSYPMLEGKGEPDPDKTYFNFKGLTPVSGCPVIGGLKNAFGASWEDEIYNRYSNIGKFENRKANTKTLKTKEEVITDIWHVLFTFGSTEKLREFALQKLKCDNKTAEKFSTIRIRREYASLSLKAINNILPYLHEGHIFSHAVFLGNIHAVLGKENWSIEGNRKLVIERIPELIERYSHEKKKNVLVNELVHNFNNNYGNAHKDYALQETDKQEVLKKIEEVHGAAFKKLSIDEQNKLIGWVEEKYQAQLQKGNSKGEFIVIKRIDKIIAEYLTEAFNGKSIHPEKLYHPSDIDIYPKPPQGDDGKTYLGSPIVSAIKNPMAMRSLHQLRKLLNTLIREGTLDDETQVNIELARELNDTNHRRAIKKLQDEQRDERKKYRTEIKELYKVECDKDIEPTETEIIKYQLWIEQNRTCVYTGINNIGICDFIGGDPKYDIEHTLPRGSSQDNSLMNKTLALVGYNRQIKGVTLPRHLNNFNAEYEFTISGKKVLCNPILKAIEPWKIKAEEYEKLYYTRVKPKGIETKEKKDKRIQDKHYYKMQWDYWKSKYDRFTMTEITRGFKNSQMVDTGIITKYARAYLNSVFPKVHSYKGELVAEFRKCWGLQEVGEKKDRSSHIHHCIDAITIACMTKGKYDILAHAWEMEDKTNTQEARHTLENSKPWKSFTKDMLGLEENVLITHYTPDNIKKQTIRKLRSCGKIVHKAIYELDANGNQKLDEKGKRIFKEWTYENDIDGELIPQKGKKLSSDERGIMVENKDYFNATNKKTGEIISYRYVFDKGSERVFKKVAIFQKGDTVRGSLHQDTYYGAIKIPLKENGIIQRDSEKKILFEKDKNGDDKIRYVIRKEISKLSEGDIENIVDSQVKEIFEQAIKDKTITFKIVNGKKIAVVKSGESIWRNKEKKILIKKVRCFSPFKDVLRIKTFRKSDQKLSHSHKWNVNVVNDTNYCMALYEGKDSKGAVDRVGMLINTLDAGSYYKLSNKEQRDEYPLAPLNHLENGFSFQCLLTKGQMVLLYNKMPDEIWESEEKWMERLYTITGLDDDGIKLMHHIEARGSTKVIAHMNDVITQQNFKEEKIDKEGKPKQSKLTTPKGGSVIGKFKEFPYVKFKPNGFNALLEGIDFQLTISGKIERIK